MSSSPRPPLPPQPPQPPYQPPQPAQPVQPLPYATPGAYGSGVQCPRCGNPANKAVNFTWWGGVIGPKILSHVKCLHCGTEYNGKTGKSNTTGIIIYSVVALVLALVVVLLVALA